MALQKIGIGENYTPSDTAPAKNINWVWVTGEGNIAIQLEGGETKVITGIPVSNWWPVGNTVRIMATNTTATGIFVM